MSSLRLVALVALAAVAGCDRGPPPPPEPGKPGDLRFVPPVYPDAGPLAPVVKYRDPTRPPRENTAVTASGKTFMIVSEDGAATRIGHAVLAGGGNAVDAAVATALALTMVHPSAASLGGSGIVVVHPARGKATAFELRDGIVAGLAELHGKHGKQAWRELVTPSIALAKDALKPTLEAIANGTRTGAVTAHEALRFTYRGHAIATAPTTGGKLLAAIAGSLQGTDLGGFAWHGHHHVQHLATAWKQAFETLQAPAPGLATPVAVIDGGGLAVAIALTTETVEVAASTLAPWIASNVKGDVALVGGGGGRPRESLTASFHTLSNVIDFSHRASLAANNPRVHRAHHPDTLFVEDHAIDADTESKLRDAGHVLEWTSSASTFGIANVIARTATGWDGAADARSGGAALGD